MKTYEQIRQRKEFHQIKAIADRLEERDIEINNPDYKGTWYRVADYYDMQGNCYFKWSQSNLKKTYCTDLWYLFDLLEWTRQKRWTL